MKRCLLIDMDRRYVNLLAKSLKEDSRPSPKSSLSSSSAGSETSRFQKLLDRNQDVAKPSSSSLDVDPNYDLRIMATLNSDDDGDPPTKPKLLKSSVFDELAMALAEQSVVSAYVSYLISWPYH